MDMNDKKMLFYLERLEGAMGRMYRYFAKTFPPLADFWLEIARQETHHARSIMSLQQRANDQTVSLADFRFDMHAIQQAIAAVEETTHQCLKGELTLLQALQRALDFEDSPMESQFYAVFEFFGDFGREIQRLLETETDHHRQAIAAMLSRVQTGA